MEILSPAGSMEAAINAVNNGADAVYAGGEQFSARKNAHNFNREQLAQLVEYCHVRGVQVYLAVNILIHDYEFEKFADYIAYAYNIGVDAAIVQDVGAFCIVKETAPLLKIHASTQMTIYNTEGVQFLERLGFQRVVLARELSFEQIKNITENCNIETEVFIHGALCVSVSGQCLMSSVIGCRSGNRGQCAQPCRLSYKLIDNKQPNKKTSVSSSYLAGFKGMKLKIGRNESALLSLKDLSLITCLNKLKQLKISSYKIEGRMKSPYYVALTAGLFKKYLTTGQAVSKEDYKLLLKAFNREGFTEGYFSETDIGEMMSRNHSGNIGTRQENVDIFSRNRQINVYGECIAEQNKPVIFSLWDDDGNKAVVQTSQAACTADQYPTTVERLEQQLSKMGGTAFSLKTLKITVQPNIFVSVSLINTLRRNAVTALEKERNKLPEPVKPIKINLPERSAKFLEKDFELSAQINNLNQAEKISCLPVEYLPGCVYIPLNILTNHSSMDVVKKFKRLKVRVYCLIPMWHSDLSIVQKINTKHLNGFVIGNIGSIGMIEKYPKHDFLADVSFNIFNSLALGMFKKWGFNRASLSVELTAAQIKGLHKSMPTESIIYGRVTLMTMAKCIFGKNSDECSKGCADNRFSLSDRRNMIFPVLTDKSNCTSSIINSTPIFMADKIQHIKESGVDVGRMVFTIETPEQCQDLLIKYKDALLGKTVEHPLDFTRGHFYRGV